MGVAVVTTKIVLNDGENDKIQLQLICLMLILALNNTDATMKNTRYFFPCQGLYVVNYCGRALF